MGVAMTMLGAGLMMVAGAVIEKGSGKQGRKKLTMWTAALMLSVAGGVVYRIGVVMGG